MISRIELEGIGKQYGSGSDRITALHDVSLSVEAGAFVAIEGPSGSGKSTLLNLCGLMDSADSGRYLLDGQDVTRLSSQTRCTQRRREIGFIFQRHQLIPAMTVYENIAYPLFLLGTKSGEIRPQVEQLLDRVGLSHRLKHLPAQLSGGERQRVGIARALIKRPTLVIADEPSASLDHAHVQTSLTLMRELNREEGASFLIASHDRFVIDQCDRSVRLIDGRIEARP